MKTSRVQLLLAVLFLGLLSIVLPARTPRSPGDRAAYAESLGQKQYAHVPIHLLDEKGSPVEPGSDTPRPYSPRTTCGACHDYETINKAYHFQFGADVMSDDFGDRINRPWMSSRGMFGRQIHMSYAWVAKKRNASGSHVGMTSYQYCQTCGACHAGGGPMERDRDGRRYDLRLAKAPDLAARPDGDYYKSAWDKSGVVEVDCLMCHLVGYDGQARAEQLSKSNFRWAATVGAGFASVEGAVGQGEVPRLTYNKSIVNKDGRVSLRISRSEDAGCLLCHGEAETKKRGHVWHDSRQQDVHAAAGMKCITCHSSGPDHQIRKGHSNDVLLHDELDDLTFSCDGCHFSSKSPNRPAHRSIPKSHLSKIACVTCHVTEQKVAAVGTVDTLTGKAAGIPTVRGAKKYGETGDWTRACFRLKDGKIYSGNALLPAWWGNRVAGVVHPLFLSETERAYERAKDSLEDDNGDGKPEANTEGEITAMLRSIGQVLAGGRFAAISPAYVKGEKLWELVGGRLVARRHPQAAPLYWTFSHNVSPPDKALGAGGCSDCHGEDSAFFSSPVVVDPYGLDGREATIPMWKYCGISESVIEEPQ